MNIAFYSHYFSPEIGAPSARIYDLSQQWLALNHRVQVVTCFPNHPLGSVYEGYDPGFYMHEDLEGISVHRHWTYITPNKGFLKKSLGHLSYLPSAMFLSHRHVSAPDVAIGTSPTFFAAMGAAYAGFRRKIPFIMEVRDLWPAIFVELGVLRNPRLIRWLERWELALYRRASRVITVTDAFRRDLIDRGVPERKVTTIRNGADVDFWRTMKPPERLRRRLGLDESFVVLYIGAHGISHALGSVLKAAEKLRDHSSIRFLFVGEGAEKDQLIQQARNAGLENVRFLDAVDRAHVRDFYALADACLVPLRDIPLFDSFIPSKIFEIMSMARPIIGSVRGETADILRQSEGALVIKPEDSDALAESIQWLYEHPDERRSMGKKGRQFAISDYSRRSQAELYVRVMEEAVREFHIKPK